MVSVNLMRVIPEAIVLLLDIQKNIDCSKPLQANKAENINIFN